jgi:hypothetical protein
MTDKKTKCPKCGSTNLAVERRLDGDATCGNCKWTGPYKECFVVSDTDKKTPPRDFWLHAGAKSLDDLDYLALRPDESIAHEFIQVVEKKAYDDLLKGRDALADELAKWKRLCDFLFEGSDYEPDWYEPLKVRMGLTTNKDLQE